MKNIQKNRTPMTTQELEQLLPSDLARIKLMDCEKQQLREIQQRRQSERVVRAASIREEETPLLEELQHVGLKLNSVWDLVNSSREYTAAIPILLKHLVIPYSDRIREGIARALAVDDAEAKRGWPVIHNEFCKAETGKGAISIGDKNDYRLGTKDALAVALSVLVTEDKIPEMIALINDSIHGDSRLLLLQGLKKYLNINSQAQEEIQKLKNDQFFWREISSWKV